jgi:hypothetical protein
MNERTLKEDFMAIKITESEEKIVAAKKSIKLDGIFVKDLKFVDETGDITQQVIDALPEGTIEVGFKITVELPSEE